MKMAGKYMKISIIVPIYNIDAFIQYCVRSVQKQTFGDFELLLVDDGSTDGSGCVCDSLAREDARIRVLHRKNGGPLDARLAGIREATGEVLVFLDGDDSLRPDALEQIAGCFAQQDCDLVLYDAGTCEDYDTLCPVNALEPRRLYRQEEKKLLYAKLIDGSIPNCIWQKAVKRSLVQETEVLARLRDLKYGEDLLMTAQLLTDCSSVYYLPEGLYRYRNRPGSAIHALGESRTEAVKAVHGALAEYLELWNMPELTGLHSCRKVKGWAELLLVLLKNRQELTAAEFETRLHDMARDPYFRKAYRTMDPRGLSPSRHLAAHWLVNRQYGMLRLLAGALEKRKG